MKKIDINMVLVCVLLFIIIFLHTGCQGGNPFNFIIGKMTKSVEKEKPISTDIIDDKTPKVPEESAETKVPIAKAEEDSLKILEMALGIEYFRYKSEGRRDPFETLFKGREINVENVKLVGTIWGPKGRFALLKEPGGSGFVVGIGDRIADGRVIDITSTSITFQISKFGVTSRVTKVLEEKEETLK
ncbi:hypothetical protein KAU34_12020 [candidate division WOR-3 bacterium]|nr:hypothetical protein [candidate division WOR-3 bacterium]MCK4577128.1 hypothetical protein [candidate division WOR-3 bacterium]